MTMHEEIIKQIVKNIPMKCQRCVHFVEDEPILHTGTSIEVNFGCEFRHNENQVCHFEDMANSTN